MNKNKTKITFLKKLLPKLKTKIYLNLNQKNFQKTEKNRENTKFFQKNFISYIISNILTLIKIIIYKHLIKEKTHNLHD